MTSSCQILGVAARWGRLYTLGGPASPGPWRHFDPLSAWSLAGWTVGPSLLLWLSGSVDGPLQSEKQLTLVI